MIHESVGKLFLKVSFSNNKISRIIHYMTDDLNDEFMEKIKGKSFELQLNDTTNINTNPYLICYVKFLDEDDVVENLLFYKNISASTMAQDLFKILDNFMSESSVDWTKRVGVCTHSARSMSDYYGGFYRYLFERKLLCTVDPFYYS